MEVTSEGKKKENKGHKCSWKYRVGTYQLISRGKLSVSDIDKIQTLAGRKNVD